MKPTGRETRLWPDDAAGLRALVSVRWNGLNPAPARRPREAVPADRNAAVAALFARTLYAKRRAGHAGVEFAAPAAPRVLRVFPIVPDVVPTAPPAPLDDPPERG